MNLACLALLGTFMTTSVQTPKTLPNGDRVNFDGAYYDFRAADGKSMLKLWVPPAAKPVRGILISGHGGGSGDSRNFVRDQNMKALAARFGFGLVGLHTFPGRQVFDTGGKVFFGALDEFAKLGRHPELANVPFAFFGSSNGGSEAYGFANYAPKRAICFVSNVAAWFNPATPVPDALEVPGLFVMGRYDPFCDNEEGVKLVGDMVAGARAKGARWGMIVEDKGHEDGIAFDVFIKLFERSVALRYPADADPRKGPVALKTLPENSGYLADVSTWESGYTEVVHFTRFGGDRSRTAWLPDREMAMVYRAAATRQHPVGLGVDEVGRVYNPNTDPFTMFSIGGPVVEPGRELKLVADVRDIPDWTRIEFFDGARNLGTVLAPAEPTLTVRVGPDRPVWCLYAIAGTPQGAVRTSAPFYIAVKDPSIPLLSEAEKTPKPDFIDPVGVVGSKSPAGDPKPSADPAVLVAAGLTAEQEKTFGADPAKVSAFWAAVPAEIDLRQATHAREGSAFSIVHTQDARLRVKAAHSARGLYLCFETTDNRFMNADPRPDAYHNTDAVDVLLDSRSSDQVNDPAHATEAICADWGLSLTTKQYQVAHGNDAPPEVMKRLAPDPFDLDFSSITPLAEVRRTTGMQVRFVKLSRMTRVQEWFIPWSEVGLPGEPTVGSKIAFAPAYNDADPGEAARKQLCWIGNTSPWAHSMVRGEAPRGWGDIEIGPTLK